MKGLSESAAGMPLSNGALFNLHQGVSTPGIGILMERRLFKPTNMPNYAQCSSDVFPTFSLSR